MAKKSAITTASGIGELYGTNLLKAPKEIRSALARDALSHQMGLTYKICPFQPDFKKCTKKGGVCSTRLYAPGNNGEAVLIAGPTGAIRPACPHRMNESLLFQRLAGKLVLGVDDPIIVPEVSLKRVGSLYEGVRCHDVGRLDFVLIDRVSMKSMQKNWVALEMQSSYFSGDSMRDEFISLRDSLVEELPYPVGRRRTDDKSSLKRLLTQLQEKVPVLRRWGKKMVIVVDHPFVQSLGNIKTVSNISNSDIVWFVAGFGERADGDSEIECQKIFYSTLEQAVDILSGGEPMPRDDFETALSARVASMCADGV